MAVTSWIEVPWLMPSAFVRIQWPLPIGITGQTHGRPRGRGLLLSRTGSNGEVWAEATTHSANQTGNPTAWGLKDAPDCICSSIAAVELFR